MKFQLFRHPLANVPPDVVKAALLEMAARNRADFPTHIATLMALFPDIYPPAILGVMAGYGRQAGVGDDGVASHTLIRNLEQHHLELLQALILMIPFEDWGQRPLAPTDTQLAIDTVIELAHAFHRRRFSAIDGQSDRAARAVLTLQEQLRMHTQMVRNWGYFSDVVHISLDLYAPLDGPLREAHGFSATNLIMTAQSVLTLLERRGNARFQWLRRAFREKNISRLVRLYFANQTTITGDPEEFLGTLPKDSTREHVIYGLLAYADNVFFDIMRVNAEEIADLSGLSDDITRRVLNGLSLNPGSLQGEDPERVFMGNPVWRNPVMKLDGQYFCPMPQNVFSHIHEIMRALGETAGLKKNIEQRRAEYLESKVKALLSKALPTAVIRDGVTWCAEGTTYETDHLVVIDSTVVIVEDKSATLTARGLRGAPDRMRRHVQDLIHAPSEQSGRLQAEIWRAKSGDPEALGNLAPFKTDFGKIERILRISVTLDDFSVLASLEGDLKAAGWIPPSLDLAPTINVADMQCIIDLLERQAFILHYFAERERIQKALHLVADEMDLLGCYLETGFNLGTLEKPNTVLGLTGMSRPIDHYYTSRDAGVRVPKPKPNLTPYFSQLIETIERRAFPRWSVVTTDLLRCANYNEQKKLNKCLTQLKSNVERKWRDPSHECSLVITPPASRDTAVVFYVYPPQLASRRKEIAEGLAAQALQTRDRKRCIMICRNTSRWSDPYSSIVIANAASDGAIAPSPTPAEFERE